MARAAGVVCERARTYTGVAMSKRNPTWTIGLVQQRCSEDREHNLRASFAGVREAAAQGAELVLLQELHAGVYFCQTEDTARFDQAESIPGPGTEQLGELARELGVVIVGSLFERRAPGLYHNTAVVLERDGTWPAGTARCTSPTTRASTRSSTSRPATSASRPVSTSVGKLGVLVCWDQWYPEAARLMALAGAELLLYPTAIGWDPRDSADERARQRDAWITVQRGHAIANGLPVVVANRVGREPDPSGQGPGLEFWGSSFVCGPQGELLASAAIEEASVLVTRIERARSEQVRRLWPYLRDRRIDAYADITRRYRD